MALVEEVGSPALVVEVVALELQSLEQKRLEQKILVPVVVL